MKDKTRKDTNVLKAFLIFISLVAKILNNFLTVSYMVAFIL